MVEFINVQMVEQLLLKKTLMFKSHADHFPKGNKSEHIAKLKNMKQRFVIQLVELEHC